MDVVSPWMVVSPLISGVMRSAARNRLIGIDPTVGGDGRWGEGNHGRGSFSRGENRTPEKLPMPKPERWNASGSFGPAPTTLQSATTSYRVPDRSPPPLVLQALRTRAGCWDQRCGGVRCIVGYPMEVAGPHHDEVDFGGTGDIGDRFAGHGHDVGVPPVRERRCPGGRGVRRR